MTTSCHTAQQECRQGPLNLLLAAKKEEKCLQAPPQSMWSTTSFVQSSVYWLTLAMFCLTRACASCMTLVEPAFNPEMLNSFS